MPLVDLRDMLHHAKGNGYAVASFDIDDHELLEGALDAAERCAAPLILTINESQFDQPRRILLLMTAMVAAARDAGIAVALLLKAGTEPGRRLVEAIRLGCNGVAIEADGSDHAEAAALARRCGITLGASLPALSGEEADPTGGTIESLRPDFMIVPSSAGDTLERLVRLADDAGLPLMVRDLAGGDSRQFPDAAVGGFAALDRGGALAAVGGDTLRALPAAGRWQTALRRAACDEAERTIRSLEGTGKSAALLDQCRRWTPVEHLIVYNVEGLDEQGVESMMATGRRVLGEIPGVQEVFTGRAINEKAGYRYCWLVRFTHPAVIEHYAAHPDHVAFADRLFRPVAGNRITIDYQQVETGVPQDLSTAGKPGSK